MSMPAWESGTPKSRAISGWMPITMNSEQPSENPSAMSRPMHSSAYGVRWTVSCGAAGATGVSVRVLGVTGAPIVIWASSVFKSTIMPLQPV